MSTVTTPICTVEMESEPVVGRFEALGPVVATAPSAETAEVLVTAPEATSVVEVVVAFGAVVPGAVVPGAVVAGAVEPGTVEPGAVEPGAVEPGAVVSGTVVTTTVVAGAVVVVSSSEDGGYGVVSSGTVPSPDASSPTPADAVLNIATPPTNAKHVAATAATTVLRFTADLHALKLPRDAKYPGTGHVSLRRREGDGTNGSISFRSRTE